MILHVENPKTQTHLLGLITKFSKVMDRMQCTINCISISEY